MLPGLIRIPSPITGRSLVPGGRSPPAIATVLSGLPYSETTGNDDFHTGLDNARPVGIGRNTLQGGGTTNLDLQWSHEFHLTRASGEKAKILSTGVSAFNVLNHANYVDYVGALTSPFFRQPTSALNGRQMQLSAGYRF